MALGKLRRKSAEESPAADSVADVGLEMKVLFLLLTLCCVVASAQTTRFTKASKIFDVVVDSGPCGEDNKCGPLIVSLYRKRSTKPIQKIVGGRIAKSDLDVPIQFVDFNFDGVKDLALFDGFEAPGGNITAAQRIYLYSRGQRQFIFNRELSSLSHRESIDSILDRKGNLIMTYARPGGGFFQWRGYAMVNNKPVMFYERTEDATIENGTLTLVTTRKLVHGRWRTWRKRFKGPLNQ